jgi:hypothetical protein
MYSDMLNVTVFISLINSTERQKKEIRRSTGNTKRGGQFDILSSFEAKNKWYYMAFQNSLF